MIIGMLAGGAQDRHQEASTAPLGDAPTMGGLAGAVMQELRARLFGADRPSVGRYTLMEVIGRGSFGAVHRALDPQLEREVAIKLLRYADPDALLVEAQRAARLAHPNIVAVHDVGLLDDGGAFLVMDLVQGPTLHEWLKTPRSPEEIVTVLTAAGRGLAAAHEAALVHRDFKPANVLIAGDEGRPMVADFGLAVAPERHDTGDHPLDDGDSTIREVTPQLVGTPRYMAPELLVGRPADERSDQYAFCLTLREALTRAPVFEASSIQDQLPLKCGPLPPWPRRSKVPRRWRTIIDRGLATDPRQRWPSMRALLATLHTATQRDRSVRRRVGSLAGTALATAVVVSTVLVDRDPSPCEAAPHAIEADALWTHDDASRVRAQFERLRPAALDHAWPRLDHALSERSAAWSASVADNCQATFVEHEQSKADLTIRGACLDRVEAEIASTVEILASADFDELGRAMDLVMTLPDPAQCADPSVLARRYRTPEQQAQMTRVTEQRRALSEARVLRRAGRLPEAEGVARAALAEAEAIGFVPLVPEARVELGVVLHARASYVDAEAQLRRTLDEALGADVPMAAVAAASSLSLLVDEAKAQRAEAQSLAMIAQSLGQRPEVDTSARADALHNFGIVLRHADRLAESEARHREALAMRTTTMGILSSSEALAVVLADQRRLDEAAALMERTLSERERLLGPMHPDVAHTHLNLGWIANEQGHAQQAIVHFEAAITQLVAAHGPHHPDIAIAQSNLGAALASIGDYVGAERTTREALELERAIHGEQHPAYAISLGNLGYLQLRAGQLETARGSLERALEIEGCEEPTASMRCAANLSNLAEVVASMGDGARAEAYWTRAIALAERRPETLARASKPLTALGRFYVEHGRAAEAVEVLERAASLDEEHDAPAPRRAATQRALAEAHAATGDEARARQRAQAAATLWAEAGEQFEPQRREAAALAQRLSEHDAV